MTGDHFTAAEAAAFLGISKATLYAYVSRGLVPAERTPDGRQSRYPAAAIRALKQQREAPRGAVAIRQALDFGQPVFDSAITLIEDGRLYFRGHDAERLAATATLEEVAEIIWGSVPAPPSPKGPLPGEPQSYLERLQSWMATLQARDRLALDRSPAGVQRAGAAILDLAARAAGGTGSGPVHERLARGWQADEAGADLIRAALVLCADHELNASTFAARIVASTGATPYAAIQAGLAALSGPHHGGTTYRVSALLDEVGDQPPVEALAARLRRGEDLPGFGHRLYPDRDPRAAFLLDRLVRSFPREGQPYAILADAARALTGLPPTVDYALVAVARLLRGPEGGAFQLFATGRIVGWIGHSLEQYQSGQLLRPRARYSGPRPVAIR
jgi:citrate synthase